MRRAPQKLTESGKNYENDPRLRSPVSHISGSLRYKDQYTSPLGYYRKGSYNAPSQNDYYYKSNQRLEDRKNYDSYAGYSSIRGFLEESSSKHSIFSSTGNLNSSIQATDRENKYQTKNLPLRRESSLQIKQQPYVSIERSYLEQSKVPGTSPNHLIRSDKYYTNVQVSPFSQHTYRKQALSLLPDRRHSLLKQPFFEEEPYFQYILRYSYRSKRGYSSNNPSKLNQDAFVTIPNINSQTFQHYFGVCDGHGTKGHLVSSFIKSKLPSALAKIKNVKKPQDELTEAHKQISDQLLEDQSIDTTYSGSTSVGCYLNHNKLYCCNVGDSRAIMGRKSKTGQWTAKALTTDHKPCLERQAARITKAGGRIEACKDNDGDPVGPLRVWFKQRSLPGLAMTRSFGDTVASPIGVNSIPQIDQYTLSTEDRIVVIASDGLWQFLSNQQVIEVLSKFYDQNKIQQSCNTLLQTSITKWKQQSSCRDDITFVVLFLDYAIDRN